MRFKRMSVGVVLLPFVVIVAAAAQKPAPDAQLLARAKAIHERAITLDSHVDISGANYATPEVDPGIDNPRLKCDLTKMERGGVKGVFLSEWDNFYRGFIDVLDYRCRIDAIA